MNFYDFQCLLYEVVELAKPSGKVVRKTIIKDKGTNVARRVIQFQYRTKLGNDVKLRFEPKDINSYDVMFYVNDVLYDFASKMGADLKPEKYARDAEILSGVFYLIKEKAKSLRAKYLSFHSSTGERDTKIIRDMDVDVYKAKVAEELQKFLAKAAEAPVEMLPPSDSMIALFQKLKKGVPQPTPSFNKEYWLTIGERINAAIAKEGQGNFDEIINQLYTAMGLKKLPFDPIGLIVALRNLENAFASNRPEGYKRVINRRTEIYKRILERNFAADWDIKVSGNNFNLTRKGI